MDIEEKEIEKEKEIEIEKEKEIENTKNDYLLEEINDLDTVEEEETVEIEEEEDNTDIEEKKDEEVIEEKEAVEEDPTEKEPVEEDTEKSKEEVAKVSAPVSDSDQIKTLMTEINRLNGLVTPSKSETKTDLKEIKDEVFDFIKDIDMDDLASNPIVFNKVLHEVIKKVQKQTTEQVLLNIPEVVMSQVQQQSFVKRKADRFYSDNKDLVNVRSVVKACAEQLQHDNPAWGIDEIFKNAAIKTRETLGMSADVVNINKEIASVEDVAFAGSKGGSKNNQKRKKTSLQLELDEL